MYRIILILLIGYTGLSKPTNFEIQDSLIKDFFNEIIQEIDSSPEAFNLSAEKHNSSWLIEQNGIKKLINSGMKYNDSSDYSIKIFVKRISPEYVAISKDSIKRNINLKLAYSIHEKAEVITTGEKDYNYSDIIDFDDISYIEDANYNFTRGNTPEIPASFWTEYAEPVIIISAAIVTVVLFFSVRSG